MICVLSGRITEDKLTLCTSSSVTASLKYTISIFMSERKASTHDSNVSGHIFQSMRVPLKIRKILSSLAS